ncbi:MAG: hypothetical protein IPK88_12410 [Saprospiraceae bacterium]|nr:hypothetical protein [Candidatus Defluviibacterium haderslevense]
MLRYNTNIKSFEPLSKAELKTENILERYDFQQSIVNSWDTVKNELGLPSAYLIGQEIKPHSSVGNSIDLLAFDSSDSSLIVIELKRDKDKFQLLQSLSYASMVANWDNEKLISTVQRDINPEPSELIDLINNNQLNEHIKIILISEFYDPEVIIASEWLINKYGLDITCFAVQVLKLEDQIFFNFEQRLPLKELSEVYEERTRKSKPSKLNQNITWEEVLPKLKYSFAKRALDFCLKYKEGDPSRRRFGGIRRNYDGFEAISTMFREKFINVYITGRFEGAENLIQEKMKRQLEIGNWQNGYSFYIDNEKDFNSFVNWIEAK